MMVTQKEVGLEIAENLKKLRKQRKLSQTALVKREASAVGR